MIILYSHKYFRYCYEGKNESSIQSRANYVKILHKHMHQ